MDIRRIASPLTPFDQDYNVNCKENEKSKKEEIETILKKPEGTFCFYSQYNIGFQNKA